MSKNKMWKKKNAKPHENHKCQQFWNTTTNILSKKEEMRVQMIESKGENKRIWKNQKMLGGDEIN